MEWISLSVETFVVERRPYRDFFESTDRGEDVVRVIGMRPDHIEFLRIEFPGLVEDGVRDGDLPEVVEIAGDQHQPASLFGKTHLPCQLPCYCRDARRVSGCEPAAKIDDPAEDLRDLLHCVEIKFHTRPLNHTGKHGVDPGGGEIEPERLFCSELAETLDDLGREFLSGQLRYSFNDRFGLHENPRPPIHSPVYMVGEGEH